MSMFTLAISCLITSNFSWFMDLTFQVLCNIALYSIRPCLHHQSQSQLGFGVALAPSLHSFWSYFSTDHQHIGHLPTWGVHLSVSYLFDIQSAKTRPRADCGSDHELLIPRFRLKLKKMGITIRPFMYDLNQIPYDYIEWSVQRNRGKQYNGKK